MEAYTDALCRAMDCTPFGLGALETVYFGGGTPSVLGANRLGRILEHAARRFGLVGGAEITVECNPRSSLPEELRRLRSAGVNRLSIGLQSADEGLLRFLGRPHTAAKAAQAVEAAHIAGFRNISLDLMLALPGQTMEQIESAVDTCAALGAAHVSAYLLKVEEGTPFALRGVAAQCPDGDAQADLYLGAAKALEKCGYRQYEISNFARDGLVSRHNVNYWDCGEYLGLGPSAHAFAAGERFYFLRDLRAFLEAPNPFALAIADGAGGGAEEYLMLRLRLSEGVRWDSLESRYPAFNGAARLRKKARPLEEGGLAVCDDAGLRLTREGMLVSNSAISMLLEAL